MVRRKHNDGAVFVWKAERKNFRHGLPDLKGGEVDDRCHLATNDSGAVVMFGYLCARSLDADGGAEIDGQL